MSAQTGVLYVVATPLGNLGDMTYRAVETLRQADIIAAEDTRHSRKLLEHYAISTPLVALHEHNEPQQARAVLTMLLQGKHVALISDAGTPLISDPGFVLIREVRAAGVQIVPVPGPSAVITALSVAGLPTDRFTFEGFLPAKAGARRACLHQLRHEARTLIFYEAPHRLLDTLQDIAAEFGPERPVVLARELTKTYETVCAMPAHALYDFVAANKEQQLGEMVLLVQGVTPDPNAAHCEIEVDVLLARLLEHMTVKSAAQLAAAVTGLGKNTLYERALQLSQRQPR